MIRVLSTKRLEPNQRQYLLNGGISVLAADFIDVSYFPFDINRTKESLIFTSRNGFLGFLENKLSGVYTGSDVFCVGSVTATLIERHGFNVIASADDGKALSQIIVNEHAGKSFTFFSGSLRRDVLPDAMKAAGIDFNEIGVYQTVLTPRKINAQLDGILFYSPSGIESYLKQNSITGETCFCIGNTTAAALKGITDKIVTATKPSIENVIVQVRNYYKV
ncbi:MAG: uroporphyrinogen-III synthase [Flavobacterium sp.]